MRAAASSRLRSLPELREGVLDAQDLDGLGRFDVAADVQVVVVRGDLLQIGHVAEALDLGAGAEGLDDARHVHGFEEVLGLARAEVVGLGGVDEEHLAAVASIRSAEAVQGTMIPNTWILLYHRIVR